MCGIAGIFTADQAAGQPEFEQAVHWMMAVVTRC